MAKATISRVSQEELAQAQTAESKQTQHQTSPAIDVQPRENRKSLYSTEFIKRLKLEEIENFFAPFGLMACAKIPNEKGDN